MVAGSPTEPGVGAGAPGTPPVGGPSGPGAAGRGADELVLSHFCIRNAGFEERVAAAAAAGVSQIGLLHRSYAQLRAGGATPGSLRAVLDRHGVRVSELEVLRPWAEDERGRAAAAEGERLVMEMAETFGARYLQVIGPCPPDMDRAAEVLAGLCDRAAEVGLVVGVEFLPFTNIADAGVALDLVLRTGRRNAGICIDSWHHFRGADDWSLLERLPPDRIAAVQLNDGPLVPEDPDYLADCLANRQVPGRGAFDLPRLVGLLRSRGVGVPLSMEVISTRLDALAPGEAVRRIVDATRSLLAGL